jgi:hypothetical protein
MLTPVNRSRTKSTGTTTMSPRRMAGRLLRKRLTSMGRGGSGGDLSLPGFKLTNDATDRFRPRPFHGMDLHDHHRLGWLPSIGISLLLFFGIVYWLNLQGRYNRKAEKDGTMA